MYAKSISRYWKSALVTFATVFALTYSVTYAANARMPRHNSASLGSFELNAKKSKRHKVKFSKHGKKKSFKKAKFGKKLKVKKKSNLAKLTKGKKSKRHGHRRA